MIESAGSVCGLENASKLFDRVSINLQNPNSIALRFDFHPAVMAGRDGIQCGPNSDHLSNVSNQIRNLICGYHLLPHVQSIELIRSARIQDDGGGAVWGGRSLISDRNFFSCRKHPQPKLIGEIRQHSEREGGKGAGLVAPGETVAPV